MMRRALAVVAAAGMAAALSGCITLFPKTAPAQLYRFEASVPAAQQSGAAPFQVRAAPIDFTGPAAGDAILTSTGDEVAYLANARWDAPASDMFADTLAHGFETAGGPARLVDVSAAGHDDYRLQVAVTRFEARFDQGPTAPPTIVVRVHATLVHEKDLTPAGDRVFEASVPAASDHISDIVPAFDQATTKVVTDLVTWVNQGGG
jgi:cholesterol transport system auxiliary component